MSSTAVRANARALPESNTDPDAWFACTMEKLKEDYAQFMALELDYEISAKLDQCKSYLEFIDRTPAKGRTGRMVKEEALKFSIELYGGDIDVALKRECHGSFRSLSLSLARDIIRLDAA
ncbi:MAG: hypothetical protein WAN05_14805 [Roseiarcus sp.]